LVEPFGARRELDTKVAEKLAAERSKLSAAALADAKVSLGVEIQDLRNRLDERQKQLQEAQKIELGLRKRESALSDMVSTSGDAVNLGRKQLDQGQADMFTILRLGGENLAAKIELTKVRASRLRERVNLHLALGGDFKGTGAPGK